MGIYFLAAGVCTAMIAFFTDLSVLLNLVSIGTLFVFYMVANALVFRRHNVSGKTNPLPTVAYLTILTILATTFVTIWQLDHGFQHGWTLAFVGGLALTLTAVFSYKVPMVQKGKEWSVPCMPWVAAASIFLNIFLLGSVDKASYIRFLIWTIIAVVFYLLYGVHSTHDAECRNLFEIPLKEGIEYEFFARYPEQVMVKDNILANNDEDSRPVQIKVQIDFSTPGCVDSQMPQDLYEKPLPTHGDIALLVVGAPEKGKR